MKKSTLLLAVLSAAAVPFFFSCNQKNGGDDPVKTIILPEPPTKEASVKVDFKKDDLPKYRDERFVYEIKCMEFTESGRYLFSRVPTEEWKVKSTIGVEETVVGAYTTDGKGNYNCQGFGTVTISNPPSSGSTETKVEVKPSGDENKEYQSSTSATVTDTPPPANTDEGNINRGWSINGQKTLYLKVTGQGVSIEKSFDGCDLHEIASYAANNGVSSLNNYLEDFSGYKVTEIQFTGNKTVNIGFQNNKSIQGTYSLNANSKGITLTLPKDSVSDIPASKFFHGSISGTYNFDSETKMTLTLNTTIEGYSGVIEMQLTRVN